VGDIVTFDGGFSQGDIVSYDWNFDDGTTATGMGVEHQFTAAGTYTVSLVVSDAYNQQEQATHIITVQDIPTTAPLPAGPNVAVETVPADSQPAQGKKSK
jgi:PKD repeat protein